MRASINVKTIFSSDEAKKYFFHIINRSRYLSYHGEMESGAFFIFGAGRSVEGGGI
mgnify:CR=1 FL=1